MATSTLRLRHAELTRFRALRLVVRLSKHADNIDVAAAAQLGASCSLLTFEPSCSVLLRIHFLPPMSGAWVWFELE